MIFFSNQPKQQQEEYKKFLKIAGCLSNLFSDSSVPYLYYRIAEKIFCKSFNADDLSRSDVSADAKKMELGLVLKHFLLEIQKHIKKWRNLTATSLYMKI